MRHPSRRLLPLALAAVVLAACGGQEGAAPDPEAAPEAGVPDAAPEDGSQDSGAEEPEPSERSAPPEPVVRDFTIEVAAASDLDPSIAEAVRTTLEVAHEEWSLAWPVEYYVVGTDRDAARALGEEYCSARQELEQLPESFASCVDRGATLELAEVAASGGRRSFWSADPAWRTHVIFQSAPFGLLGGQYGDPGDADLQQVLHETWHGVQNQSIDPTLSFEERMRLMGPVWFIEGSAEYMGQYLRAMARAAGRLPEVPAGAGDRPSTFEGLMRNNLGAVDPQQVGECAERELIFIVAYEDPCFQSGALALGPWAIAYLTSIAGQDALLTDLHPRVEELGWQGAFEATAGMTLEEFNDAFGEFMAGSTAERMAILPDVGGA